MLRVRLAERRDLAVTVHSRLDQVAAHSDRSRASSARNRARATCWPLDRQSRPGGGCAELTRARCETGAAAEFGGQQAELDESRGIPWLLVELLEDLRPAPSARSTRSTWCGLRATRSARLSHPLGASAGLSSCIRRVDANPAFHPPQPSLTPSLTCIACCIHDSTAYPPPSTLHHHRHRSSRHPAHLRAKLSPFERNSLLVLQSSNPPSTSSNLT